MIGVFWERLGALAKILNLSLPISFHMVSSPHVVLNPFTYDNAFHVISYNLYMSS